ncbi:hypothetical protein [Actinokineospora alba]|uniref:hypothetical protein n=1 Tax=Actinokineospora alba TaxID=504798 RepID=UPI000B8587AA|nr:hypothetical protein [Actinokineospora alba]
MAPGASPVRLPSGTALDVPVPWPSVLAATGVCGMPSGSTVPHGGELRGGSSGLTGVVLCL